MLPILNSEEPISSVSISSALLLNLQKSVSQYTLIICPEFGVHYNYHGQMNLDLFKKWLTEMLLPNIPI